MKRLSAREPAGHPSFSGQQFIRLALALSFAANGLEQALRTVPGQLSAHPVTQAEHWVAGSLITLPLFAAGIWAGDWVANRAGVGRDGRAGLCKRALLIAVFAAAALTPLWLRRNRTDSLAQAQALVTPHSHGSIDVYWAAPGVIVALVCVCLVPAASWAGFSAARRLAPRLPPAAAAFLRVFVPVLLAAAAPALAWLLHRVAEHAYASQVDYTAALLSVPVHSHAFSAAAHGLARPPVTAAPFAFLYQIAHAIQDGLAGQAAGLPVAAMALLWRTRGRIGPQEQADSGKEVPQ